MGLGQLDLETGLNKVDFAIQLLQTWEPKIGYYFADSGGVDSAITRDLLIKSGVKFEGVYCVSPIDPPQIYQFLREYHPDTRWEYHARGFWKLVDKKGLPMRNRRWCCQYIKEAGGQGRAVVVGNRRAEGNIRRNQCFVENFRSKKANKLFIRPIIMFDDYDRWQYIRENDVTYCYLYDEGAKRKAWGEGVFKRLGCVLCPFSREIEREELYFPKIVANWKRACERIVEATKKRGYLTKRGQPVKYRFESGDELYRWWVARD